MAGAGTAAAAANYLATPTGEVTTGWEQDAAGRGELLEPQTGQVADFPEGTIYPDGSSRPYDGRVPRWFGPRPTVPVTDASPDHLLAHLARRVSPTDAADLMAGAHLVVGAAGPTSRRRSNAVHGRSEWPGDCWPSTTGLPRRSSRSTPRPTRRITPAARSCKTEVPPSGGRCRPRARWTGSW